MNNNAENYKPNMENEKRYNPGNNMMNVNQNYIYNNMMVNNNPINNMIYYQQMNSQKQLNNYVLNNCLQYALIKSYQRMRTAMLTNNMNLTKINA